MNNTIYLPRRAAILTVSVSVLLVALSISSPAMSRLNVVASTPDLAAIAKEVGGDHVAVKSLSSPDQNPHYVDPRPNLVVSLARADMLLANGVELEIGWLPPLQINARNAAIQTSGPGYFDASHHVRLMEVPKKVDRSMGDIHPGGNPHYLFDPRAAAKVATALAEHLATLAPDNANDFRANGRRFAGELVKLGEEQSKRFQALGEEKLKVVTYHRSLVYLLDCLGIQRPINVEPKPGVAPSPGHVARVLTTMRSQKIGTILQERFYPTKTSDTLARMANAKVVMLPGGADFEGGQSYTEHILNMVEVIHAALAQ